MGGMLVEILISCCALGGSIQSELTPACPAAFEQELGCTMDVAAAKTYFQGLRTMSRPPQNRLLQLVWSQ